MASKSEVDILTQDWRVNNYGAFEKIIPQMNKIWHGVWAVEAQWKVRQERDAHWMVQIAPETIVANRNTDYLDPDSADNGSFNSN